MYPSEVLLANYDDINYIVRYTCQNNDFDNFCKRGHRSIIQRNICPGMLMVFYIFVCFFANFLLFFIRIFVFLSFAFFFFLWNIKFLKQLTNQKQELVIKNCQQNSMNTTVSEIPGDSEVVYPWNLIFGWIEVLLSLTILIVDYPRIILMDEI